MAEPIIDLTPTIAINKASEILKRDPGVGANAHLAEHQIALATSYSLYAIAKLLGDQRKP